MAGPRRGGRRAWRRVRAVAAGRWGRPRWGWKCAWLWGGQRVLWAPGMGQGWREGSQ